MGIYNELAPNPDAPFAFLGTPIGRGTFYAEELDSYPSTLNAINLQLKTIALDSIAMAEEQIEFIDEELEKGFIGTRKAGFLKARQNRKIKRNRRKIERMRCDAPMIVKHILPLLGVHPEFSHFQMHDPEQGEVSFYKKGGRAMEVNVYFQNLPGDPDELLAAANKEYQLFFEDANLERLLGQGMTDSDNIIYDLRTRNALASRVRTRNVSGGYVASGVDSVTLELFTLNGKFAGGSITKRNKSFEVTERERAMLNGIRKDPELIVLGVSAPRIYGARHKTICMESPAGCVNVGSLPEEKVRELLPRIAKATQIIEKNTPKYLEGLVIDERNYKAYLEESLAMFHDVKRKREAQLETQTGEKAEKNRKYIGFIDKCIEDIESQYQNPLSPMNAEEYFRHKVANASRVVGIGISHKNAVEYLEQKGMFDTWLSDSRWQEEGNWLYNEERDVLYKIDENITTPGSRYSWIARVADLGHSVPEEQRDAMIDEMNPENPEDAYLSLYVTNMQSAEGFRKRHRNNPSDKSAETFFIQRLQTSRGYLDRLSDKWEGLKVEFDAEYSKLLEDADSRAA